MSESLRNRLYVLVILILGAIVTVLVLTSPGEADRVERLGNSIRCPVCQGESIADSPSTMARDMMALVSQRVEQGWSDEEIVDELLASYSGAVLLDPPASGSTLLVWVAPLVALLVGIGVIVWWERHPGEPGEAAPEPAPPSKRRMLTGGLILIGSFAAIVVAAGFFLQDDPVGAQTGIAELEGRDLDDISNETMEAVIAANLDNPQVSGMRLALAERYYSAGDYRAAFPHYLAVAESGASSDPQIVTALIRLGWMAWEGNREVEAALGMFDQALALDPASTTALYLKGQVLWCGSDDIERAEELFEQVIASGNLPQDSLEVVEAELEALRSGEDCS